MNKIRNNHSSKIHEGFDDDLSNEDSALFEAVGDYITGSHDIEDVHNDPAYAETKISVDWMINYYNNNKGIKTENKKFIREILSDKNEAMINTASLTHSVKEEIKDNKLDEITAEWVKEWHEKKQKSVGQSGESESSDFVKSALKNDDDQKVLQVEATRKSYSGKVFIRYASLAAAALVGVFIIIKLLIPSSDPNKIFNSYYQPFNAMSAVTRSMNINATESYSRAIASYKNGDYSTSFSEFSEMSGKDPGQESYRFYMGLSLLGLQKYAQAIPLLSEEPVRNGEFGKEAQWYLGLAYLKIYDEKNSRACFEFLAHSEGYYRERSEKILRRLK